MMNDNNYEPEIVEWGANLHRMHRRHLLGLLSRYEERLAHKNEIIAKHRPGTSYRTRAEREASMYQERIAKIRSILDSR